MNKHEHYYLNFKNDKELDKNVYRIMKQEHVFALFQDKKNAMSKFSNWKDGFAPQAQYSFTKQSSNVAFFDYTSHDLSVTFTKAF
ncbi:DUF560 domain-containing protein [Amylibacter sp. SFDW26]|uniref:surface lipoprotein assembly modifier n=1 Tax=Amylibacter sp. SFDW26 TaxID=2652722 RepID=UPI0012617121|nr:surface lipoprotein assembly modifier [Amylibacter sp. SFDW26]KAB7613752.1 DUF560 domain-containing protein [Amylibacter sp. SFDW26]